MWRTGSRRRCWSASEICRWSRTTRTPSLSVPGAGGTASGTARGRARPDGGRGRGTALGARIFTELHTGVYRAGFMTETARYEQAVAGVYAFLHDRDERLGRRRYLLGQRLVPSDLWLFSLLIRYDQVYGPGFRLHRYRIQDFANVWRYLRELYRIPHAPSPPTSPPSRRATTSASPPSTAASSRLVLTISSSVRRSRSP